MYTQQKKHARTSWQVVNPRVSNFTGTFYWQVVLLFTFLHNKQTNRLTNSNSNTLHLQICIHCTCLDDPVLTPMLMSVESAIQLVTSTFGLQYLTPWNFVARNCLAFVCIFVLNNLPCIFDLVYPTFYGRRGFSAWHQSQRSHFCFTTPPVITNPFLFFNR